MTHTYASYATYTVVNTVTDNGGSTASNSAAGCTVTTVSPVAGNGGPDGTVSINGGATYTNSTTVTLSLAKSGGGPNPRTMILSNDNSTWLGPYRLRDVVHVEPHASATARKTVYARFYNNSGLYGAIANDTITLDTVAPGTPTSFAKASTTISGVEHDDHLHLGRAGRRDRPRRLSRLPAADHLDGRLFARLRHGIDDL